MKTRLAAIGAVVMGCMLPAAAAEPVPVITLASIRAQLLYETTGTLSENIANNPNFATWNTTIGEGSAKEPANDMLVSVVLKSSTNEANVDKPVTLIVKDDKGKVLGKRVFEMAFIKNRQVVQSLFLTNISCAGNMKIEATYLKQKKTATVAMNCGE